MVSSRTVLGIVAVILDAFSRKVVGWAMAERPRAELTLEAFWTGIEYNQETKCRLPNTDLQEGY